MEAAYTRLMTGMGPSFWERQWEIFWHPKCELDLVVGLMVSHHQAQHGKESPPHWKTPTVTPDPRLYRFYFLKLVGSIGCPLGDYKGLAMTQKG